MTAQITAVILGIALMAAPSILHYDGVAADVDHTLGPLAVAVGLMAASQILRGLRWVNLVIAIVLGASIPILQQPRDGTLAVVLIALALVGTALVRGTISERFAGGWSALTDGRSSNSR